MTGECTFCGDVIVCSDEQHQRLPFTTPEGYRVLVSFLESSERGLLAHDPCLWEAQEEDNPLH